jgi:Glycosyltransferase
MPNHKRILFLVPYPLKKAPSQRFRVEQFLPLLHSGSTSFHIQSFFDEKAGNILYAKRAYFSKSIGLLKGFLKRAKLLLFNLRGYDYIFIHREASPIGPPVFEWYISRVRKKKIIFDYDDAIWISDSKSSFIRWVKASWKVGYIIKWSYKIAAGNEYLANYARQFNSTVVVLPTCVDTDAVHNHVKDQHNNPVVVGWTGSHSTLQYLNQISDVLEKIANEGNQILIICNKPPALNFQNLYFLPWKEETEIVDLLKINIGIMPLENDRWSEGKCGFKLIQYLSLGIPAVASPVGVNKNIITPDNGFLCTTKSEWDIAIRKLINDEALREKMGSNGRKKIIDFYSVRANAGIFLGLFN